MPLFRLNESLVFPSPELAEEDGLLAVGGDLSPERLLLAYRHGIFPWYTSGSPILWWSTDPRLVLFPQELHVPGTLRQTMRKQPFVITCDTSFKEVITECSQVHDDRSKGTWITGDMVEAYCHLHELGHAHSVEAWQGDQLVGGLYGIAVGSVYFGESMFYRVSDASKVAFVQMVRWLYEWGFDLIDCQMTTRHLERFGAREIARSEFLEHLEGAVGRHPLTPFPCPGKWHY